MTKRVSFISNHKIHVLSNLRSLLFKSKSFDGCLPSSIKVGSTNVFNLTPLGGIFKPGITKAGSVSLKGQLKSGESVKIYSCHNREHALLRLDCGLNVFTDKVSFPPVIDYDDHMILEKWIDSTSRLKREKIHLSKSNTESVIKFLTKLHQYSSDNESNVQYINSFCYIKDYLLARLSPWKNWKPISTLLDAWSFADQKSDSIVLPRFSHPDLSQPNIIIARDSKIYIIDNELLGFGKGWVIDHYNTHFRSLFPLDFPDERCSKFVELTWKLRLTGSALDSGDFHRAERMASI